MELFHLHLFGGNAPDSLVKVDLTMWCTCHQWVKASGLGAAPRKLLEELRELKSLDVLLPTR